MLGVHEARPAVGLLGLGDHVERQGGLPSALRAVDLRHAGARDAAHAEGDVELQRPGGDHGARDDGLAVQGHDCAITEALRICARAWASAWSRLLRALPVPLDPALVAVACAILVLLLLGLVDCWMLGSEGPVPSTLGSEPFHFRYVYIVSRPLAEQSIPCPVPEKCRADVGDPGWSSAAASIGVSPCRFAVGAEGGLMVLWHLSG